MNLMFWKKKSTEENSAGDSQANDLQDSPDNRKVSRKTSGSESRDKESSEDVALRDETDAGAVQPIRRLVMVAAIGMFILTIIGLVVWNILPFNNDTAPATVPASVASQPAPILDDQLIKLPPIELPLLIKPLSRGSRADIEALKKKNEELQAQIEAVKTEPPQLDKAQAEQYRAHADALTKNNRELQEQIEALKAELPKTEEKLQIEQRQASIDALTKKNNELQTQIEALKKQQLQQAAVVSANKAAGKAQPPILGGSMSIGSKNPKAAAMTLKEAIEAMNASNGDSPKNTEK